jgi:hypothetical protein
MIYAEDVFIDSGAWSLFRLNVMKAGKKAEPKEEGPARKTTLSTLYGKAAGVDIDFRKLDFSYYSLDPGSDFRAYCDKYAAFVKENEKLRLFANVDVIGNPERTWDVQKYFEDEHNLHLIPVIHVDSSMKYIDRYIAAGYKLIGFGGFASGIGGWERMRPWCNEAFMRICPRSNDYLPIVKVHGFAMTGMKGIRMWPWYSVDSTSWVIWPANGWIPVPRWNERKEWFDFSKDPFVINVCPTSKTKSLKQRHAESMKPRPEGRLHIERWLEYIDVPWGKADEEGKLIEWGVTSHHEARTVANLKFFIGLQDSIPKWPWPLSPEIIRRQRTKAHKGFGIPK